MTRAELMSSARWLAQRSACRPALAAIVFFALGITTCRCLPPQPVGLLVGIGVLLVVAGACRKRALICECALAAALLLCGAAAGQQAIYFYRADDVGLSAGDEPRPAQLELLILDEPRLESSANPHLPPRQICSASICRAWRGGRWVRASGDAAVTIGQPIDSLAAGQHVRVAGLLSRPRGSSNPGQFDPTRFSRSRRQLSTLMIPHRSGVQQLPDAGGLGQSALQALRAGARRALERGFTRADTENRALLGALVFGDRPPALQPQLELFQRAGLLHLLSSNGLRIALLVAAVFLLGRLLGIAPRWYLLGILLVTIFAGLLMQTTPQVMRPIIVGGAVTAALFWRRNVDSIQILCLVGLALLVHEPLDLFEPGFQLSFFIVLGMTLLARPLLTILSDIDARDRLIAAQVEQRRGHATVWHALRARLWPRLMETLKFGTAAWLIATPLIMFHFQQCNLWSAPLGCLVAPLVAITIAFGFLKILLTLALPVGAPMWAAGGAPITNLLRHAVTLAAHVPGSNLPASAPSATFVIGWYAVLCLVLIVARRRTSTSSRMPGNISLDEEPARSRRPIAVLLARAKKLGAIVATRIGIGPDSFYFLRRWAMPLAWSLPLLACCLWIMHPLGAADTAGRARDDELRVTLLSIGAGQCAVMQVPGGEVDLLDAGSESMVDPWRACLGPFLRQLGRDHADKVFLSHGDFDHISAVPLMLPDHAPLEVDLSPHLRRWAAPGEFADRMLQQLAVARVPTHLIWADRAVGPTPLGSSGASIEVLWPPADCDMNSNNTGLVLRVRYGGRSILFPADIQEPAERALLRLPPGTLHADVLVAPHHGSSEPATPEFVAAVAPRFIVSSNAARLTHKQRNFDEMVSHYRLYRTSQEGAITVSISRGGELRVTTFREASAQAQQP